MIGNDFGKGIFNCQCFHLRSVQMHRVAQHLHLPRFQKLGAEATPLRGSRQDGLSSGSQSKPNGRSGSVGAKLRIAAEQNSSFFCAAAGFHQRLRLLWVILQPIPVCRELPDFLKKMGVTKERPFHACRMKQPKQLQSPSVFWDGEHQQTVCIHQLANL